VQYIDTGNAFSSHRIAHLFQSLPPLLQVSCRCPVLGNIGRTDRMQLGVDCWCQFLQGSAQLPDVLARINVQKAFDAQASMILQAVRFFTGCLPVVQESLRVLMQALLTAITSLAGRPTEAAVSTGGAGTTMPQLVVIDAFSAVIAPTLGRQHMQGTLCAGPVR
jgi:hypothetical protein